MSHLFDEFNEAHEDERYRPKQQLYLVTAVGPHADNLDADPSIPPDQRITKGTHIFELTSDPTFLQLLVDGVRISQISLTLTCEHGDTTITFDRLGTTEQEQVLDAIHARQAARAADEHMTKEDIRRAVYAALTAAGLRPDTLEVYDKDEDEPAVRPTKLDA